MRLLFFPPLSSNTAVARRKEGRKERKKKKKEKKSRNNEQDIESAREGRTQWLHEEKECFHGDLQQSLKKTQRKAGENTATILMKLAKVLFILRRRE